ncbi:MULTISPECIES: truncated hemoglobin YjbI [unclassified Staphylococcus]|uniref:truncated hemoglobin YjbI n=1 Tax=unclassified Staphylococcus TaxID=91994 RepID=UPI0021CF4013|nr:MULTISPECIES: truncated hemoglobin YjbI [unclassified Staphylococcus]UXR70120.1 truncated hemoglobin YjbI [Staphylococcus sp. IVB6246]UXR72180.1 truncated hemoglobin YjbI [Staphylococcus sp. IVB6240]UXR74488.1 truncated hemoglobin YjbI [Staphylococcus sp. IVB6238]UXR76872.1 truncated hemoglobin YjbI [Staphylococcus sp. IVB6233]UXR80999.1 truncated hemoglobin YjbI [Staphylococcus sp. IVB6218]
MKQTPYEIIGQEALYKMIDHFYALVENDDRINHLFPGDFAETARKQKQFLTQFLGGPDLYTQEHGHPMLKKRHMPFVIDHHAKDAWLENIHTAIETAQFPDGVGDYLYERLQLTANYMVNTEN